jgi:thioredoxin reductase (NADPH)
MNSLKLYGADWCPHCRRAKSYLKEHNIDFEFIDVDIDEDATRLVEKINDGKRIIPTLDLNGRTFSNPDNATLADVLGINDAGVVQLYGADWCHDCRRAKSYLADNDVNFQFIDVDQHDWATEKVEEINYGKRIIPTILIDGKPHTNPDNHELKDLLGLKIEKKDKV